MAQFSVKTGQARGQADEEKKLANELGNIESCIKSTEN